MFEPLLLHADNPGPMTGSGNNTYLILGAHGSSAHGRATLIDAAQGQQAYLDQLAAQLQASEATLTRVVVTHAHHDHASGVSALAVAYPHATFHKWPWPGEDEQFSVPWQSLTDGEAIDIGGDQLVVVHTPGHSPDHVSFWHAASRTMFVGDLVTANGTIAIQASRGGDLADYLDALHHVASFAPARLLPAHGGPIGDPVRLLQRIIAHRLAREVQVLDAIANGRATVEAIAESIYDGLDPALLPAAHETVRAHLEKLRREGRARVDVDRWSTH